MIKQATYCGLVTSLKLKDIPYQATSYIKITRVPFPRISSITLSSQGCVETPAYSHAQMRAHTHDVQTPLPLTPTTKTVVGVPTSVTQKVTWKDALFPRVVPTRASALHSRELQAHNSINISNSNVNSAL